MAGAMKICRVCGREYEACRSARTVPGVFRWQEVACSPECGTIYLDRIRASRAEPPKQARRRPALTKEPETDSAADGSKPSDPLPTE